MLTLACTCGHIAENHNSPCEDPTNYSCDGYTTKCPCKGYEPSHKWQGEFISKFVAGKVD